MWDSVTAKGWWNGEFVNRKRNGEHWDCDLTITTIKDETGITYAYIGIMRDITDKKRQLAYYEACEAEMEKIQNELKEAYVDTVYMLAVASWLVQSCRLKQNILPLDKTEYYCNIFVIFKTLRFRLQARTSSILNT